MDPALQRLRASAPTELRGDVDELIDTYDALRINELQTAIASALEEQAATSDEMRRNVSDAAQGTEQISAGIGRVAEGAAATTEVVSDTEQASAALARLSGELSRLVGQFRYE